MKIFDLHIEIQNAINLFWEDFFQQTYCVELIISAKLFGIIDLN